MYCMVLTLWYFFSLKKTTWCTIEEAVLEGFAACRGCTSLWFHSPRSISPFLQSTTPHPPPISYVPIIKSERKNTLSVAKPLLAFYGLNSLFLAGKYGCHHKPTQTGADISILCRQHRPIWPKLEQHLVSGWHVANMLATFSAKREAASARIYGAGQRRGNNYRLHLGRCNGLVWVMQKHSAKARTQMWSSVFVNEWEDMGCTLGTTLGYLLFPRTHKMQEPSISQKLYQSYY